MIPYFSREIKHENSFFDDQNKAVESKLTHKKNDKSCLKGLQRAVSLMGYKLGGRTIICFLQYYWFICKKKKKKMKKILLSFVCNVINLLITVNFIQCTQVQVVVL